MISLKNKEVVITGAIRNRLWGIPKFLYYKLLKTEGTPHKIALSVAIGLFTGCIIPDFVICGQTALSLFLALKFKANPGLAIAGTYISNPISDLFMYPVFCYVGSMLIGYNLTFAHIKTNILDLINNFSWDIFWGLGTEVAISFIVGGFIFGVVGAGVGYCITYKIIKQNKTTKAKKKKSELPHVLEMNRRCTGYAGTKFTP